MKKNITLNKFYSRKEFFSAVAKQCENYLQKSLLETGSASFIVPGGTTPAPVFEQLSNSELDWQNITIAQSDERWLKADHLQSNQRLTTKNLLINQAKSAKYIAMKNSYATAMDGESECCENYKILAAPFSVTMLGMGLDGHIASLFPNSKSIEHGLDLNNSNLCIAIDATGCPVAGDYPERMSLTLSAILNSQVIILLVTGNEKLSVIEQAINNKSSDELPVSYLVNQNKIPVEIYWCN